MHVTLSNHSMNYWIVFVQIAKTSAKFCSESIAAKSEDQANIDAIISMKMMWIKLIVSANDLIIYVHFQNRRNQFHSHTMCHCYNSISVQIGYTVCTHFRVNNMHRWNKMFRLCLPRARCKWSITISTFGNELSSTFQRRSNVVFFRWIWCTQNAC